MPSKMKRTGAVNGRSPAFLEEQFLHEGILCAVCALALVLTAVLAPAAWAADGAGEVQDTAKSTLTTDDAAEMQQADAAVTALTGSDEYEQMSREERLTSAL